MIKVENIETWGFEHAIRGCRNPLNSWKKSDSIFGMTEVKYADDSTGIEPLNYIGENDLDLMKRLYKAGTEHRKYARQIFVSMDIVAPDYFFKEFSTYKVGVVENSTSTMHRIHSKEFTLDDFSCEHLKGFSFDYEKESDYSSRECMGNVIDTLNHFRELFLETKDKDYWWQIIQLLPMSYNYRRTITMNYENVFSMIHQRTGHKLDEWREFVEILKSLPYVTEITEGGNNG